MAERQQLPRITGTVYSKPVRKIVSKKKATLNQEFEFPSIVIERKNTIRDRTFIDLIEFEPAGRNVNFDGFEVGDKIEISYDIGGKEEEYKNRDGVKEKRIRNKIKAIGIRHTDIQGDTMKDLATSNKPKDDFPAPPTAFDEDDGTDQLPF